MQLVNGTALIARLAKSADDLGVRLLVEHARVAGCCTEDGAVTGAVLAGPDGETHRPRPARRSPRGRRFPQRHRASSRAVPAHPDRTGALDPRAGRDHRRRRLAGRVGRRAARHVAGFSCRVVSGVAGALPQRTGRHLPTHRRPRKARSDRRAVQRQAVRQRSRRLLPVHRRDDRRRPGRRRGGRVADLRPRVPAALPVRHVEAVPDTGVALRASRDTSRAAQTLDGTRAQVRHRPHRADQPRSKRSTSTPSSARTPSSVAAQSAFNRGSGDPDHKPNPSLAPDREGALLRDQGAARQLRHVRRAEDRPDVARAQQRRRSPSPASTPQAATRPT